MSKIKYQHYVPRFYLEGFRNREGQIWVYDKKLDKAFPGIASQIGGEKYFYDAPKLEKAIQIDQFVEKFFQPFEDIAAPILKGWLERLEKGIFDPTKDERIKFAQFLATQLIRTPSHRLFIMQMGAKIHEVALKAHLEADHPELLSHPFEITWDSAREPYLHAEYMMDLQALLEYAGILFSHIWTVLSNETRRTLYTSDSPITRRPHIKSGWRSFMGIGSKGVQIIYPLSPNFSLSLLERTHWEKHRKYEGQIFPLRMDDLAIDHDNSIQVQQSMRFLYCREDDFGLARRYCNQYPDVRSPNRPHFPST
jgi:hypothetical protein